MLYAVFKHDYLFLTDPFDLNHNLGAGVSRKSKQNYPIPHIFVSIFFLAYSGFHLFTLYFSCVPYILEKRDETC